MTTDKKITIDLEESLIKRARRSLRHQYIPSTKRVASTVKKLKPTQVVKEVLEQFAIIQEEEKKLTEVNRQLKRQLKILEEINKKISPDTSNHNSKELPHDPT